MNLQIILDGIAKIGQMIEAFHKAQEFVRNSLPVVKELMATAEALIPTSGKGRDRLEYVKSTLTTAWADIGVTQEFIDSVWPLVNHAITAICASAKPAA